MKFLATVLAMSLSLSSFAGVKEDVKALAHLAFGHDVHTVKGKTAEEMFVNHVGEDELVFKEIADMDYGDEVEEGFTSLKSAIEMGGFAEGVYEERFEQTDDAEVLAAFKAELKALKRGWSPLIKKLQSQGVRFGYTGHGPGYCGVSFIELIIVDPKENKIYEVYLSESGEC